MYHPEQMWSTLHDERSAALVQARRAATARQREASELMPAVEELLAPVRRSLVLVLMQRVRSRRVGGV